MKRRGELSVWVRPSSRLVIKVRTKNPVFFHLYKVIQVLEHHYDSKLPLILSAKCPDWRSAAGAAPVHRKLKLSIHQGRAGLRLKLRR